jgi:hypothetical protein
MAKENHRVIEVPAMDLVELDGCQDTESEDQECASIITEIRSTYFAARESQYVNGKR